LLRHGAQPGNDINVGHQLREVYAAHRIARLKLHAADECVQAGSESASAFRSDFVDYLAFTPFLHPVLTSLHLQSAGLPIPNVGAGPAPSRLSKADDGAPAKAENAQMNLLIWLPLLFVLGLAGMGLCGVFLLGCERI